MHGTGAGSPVILSSLGGLITLADPNSVPEGASPRTHDGDYLVGSWQSRAGLTNVYQTVSAQVGPNVPSVATSATWANPNNILAQDGVYTTQNPVNVSNAIDATGFIFNVPSTTQISGALVTVRGYSDVPANLSVQLLVGGSPYGAAKVISLPQSAGTISLGSLGDLWSGFLNSTNVNGLSFGVRFSAVSSGFDLATVYLDSCTITLGVNTGTSNFNFIQTFTAQDGSVKNFALDANGSLYIEDVTNSPGTLSLIMTGIAQNSYCVALNGPDVMYLSFSDLISGSDVPRQWTKNWIDRITQVGPAASPVFTPQIATGNTFAISTITQPSPNTWSAIYFLQSSGTGSTTAGNVVTVYYSDSTVSSFDPDLVNAFNSGNPVYMWVTFANLPQSQGPYVVQVTSVGKASPPGQPRQFYYFTYQLTSVAFTYFKGSTAPHNYTVNYQRSVATMTTAVAVPGLTVGNSITITGASVANYNSTWVITQALNSASMVITGTSVTGGVASFNYSLSGGSTAPPVAGQLITITGTTNANGKLNLVNASIDTSTGGTSGTFTILVSLPDATSVPESGLATTAGTQFAFDPGIQFLGTTTNPIYGNSTGGMLTFGGISGQFIGTGTRKGTVFFITRNGYYTAPAPPVVFTCPLNTTSILASNIPIGPPNVIARGIAFTEAGQNGVPGANFFNIPDPVTYIVNNVSYTATSLIIRDNVTTQTSFFFTDPILLSSRAIDIYGYNLFSQIEIGDPAWIVKYSDRNFYGLCRNKIQNFNNLSFDGGYLPASVLTPLGWTTPDAYGSLRVSAGFGNSYYIQNTSIGTLSEAGKISQTAFQDAYQTAIINANTTYSIRITARIPSGNINGNLLVTLTNATAVLGSFTIPFSSLKSNFTTVIGTLLTTKLATVPSSMMLNVSATNIGAGADIEIDRMELYPTDIPVLTTTVYASYAGLPEQVDAITGMVIFASENQQPINGAVVMYDTLYALKGWSGTNPGASMYSLQSSANLEPAQWEEPEVAQKSGAVGILAYDFGEQWIVMANRNGLYLFEGGQPGKISHEIFQVWDAINWNAARTIWVRNDVVHRRLFIGVPMATPNFWLPDTPVNANPQSPNVILMCNYQGLDSGAMLKSEPQMHTTMFGTLNSVDMRRKWSIWQIPSPYMNIVGEQDDQHIYICNGRGNSKIYLLDDSAETDDGITIDSRYTTAGLVELTKRTQSPGLGSFRIRWGYIVAALESHGTINLRLLPNRLLGPSDPTAGYNAWTVPGGFSPGNPSMNDSESSLNFVATRTYLEFRENDGHRFSLNNIVVHGKKDTWNAVRGAK